MGRSSPSHAASAAGPRPSATGSSRRGGGRYEPGLASRHRHRRARPGPRGSFAAAGAATQVRVTPRVWPLDDLHGGAGLRLGRRRDAAADRARGQRRRARPRAPPRRRPAPGALADDREAGRNLMVRPEEHPWDPRQHVSSTTAPGPPRRGRRGFAFEWAVSAVAFRGLAAEPTSAAGSSSSPSGRVCDPGHTRGEVARGCWPSRSHQTRGHGRALAGRGPRRPGACSPPPPPSPSPSRGASTPATPPRWPPRASGRVRLALAPDAAAWGAPSDEHESACSLRNRGWRCPAFGPGTPVADGVAEVARR